MKRKLLIGTILVFSLVILVGCGQQTEEIEEVTIGYFPNLTHAPGLIGVEADIFEEEFKKEIEGLEVNVKTFPKGALFMDALATDQIDIGYVGPGPVINRFVQGEGVEIIANASIGGNVLIGGGESDFQSPGDLAGKNVSTPGIACSHDILLREFMWQNGLQMENRGGEVGHIIQDPANMMELFQQGEIEAALVSEPWAALMKREIGAEILVDWDEVPWEGKMPATVIAAREEFSSQHPELVNRFLKAHQQTIDLLHENEKESIKLIQTEIKRITGQELAIPVLEESLARTQFTTEIEPGVLQNMTDVLEELEAVNDNDIEGLVNTSYLENIN